MDEFWTLDPETRGLTDYDGFSEEEIDRLMAQPDDEEP